MSSGGPRLGQVEPRERAGAQTGRKYEYQYERTARAALDLLAEDAKHVCVYCDWHDDYVIETGQPPACYLFHQVKGRKSSQGPWKFSEFFGVQMKNSPTPAKNPPAVASDAIVPLMLLHHRNFGHSCAGLAFVTNAGLDAVSIRLPEGDGQRPQYCDTARGRAHRLPARRPRLCRRDSATGIVRGRPVYMAPWSGGPHGGPGPARRSGCGIARTGGRRRHLQRDRAPTAAGWNKSHATS